MMFSFQKLEGLSHVNFKLLVVLFCGNAVSAQKISNTDKGFSRSAFTEKSTFGKDDFLAFIKGKLKLSGKINVGGPTEGINVHILFSFYSEIRNSSCIKMIYQINVYY